LTENIRLVNDKNFRQIFRGGELIPKTWYATVCVVRGANSENPRLRRIRYGNSHAPYPDPWYDLVCRKSNAIDESSWRARRNGVCRSRTRRTLYTYINTNGAKYKHFRARRKNGIHARAAT